MHIARTLRHLRCTLCGYLDTAEMKSQCIFLGEDILTRILGEKVSGVRGTYELTRLSRESAMLNNVHCTFDMSVFPIAVGFSLQIIR